MTNASRFRYAELTPAQDEENQLFSHARACVEHVDSFCIYSRAISHASFIGTFENLYAFTQITVHTTALFIRRDKSHQLSGFGDHFSPFA